MAQMIDISQQEFDQWFEKLSESKQKCVFLFTSSSDAEGKYWCKFCQKILPFYDDILKEATEKNLKVYRFDVGSLPEWKDKEHKYKKHPMLKVKSVPTLGIFDGEKLTTTLDSEEISKKDQRDLMFQFVNE